MTSSEFTNLVASYQALLDEAIDRTLDVFEEASKHGVTLDPLMTIMARLKERGQEINMDEAPPMLKMLLTGLGVEVS